MKQTIITQALIKKDERILLLRSQSGLYELPGGNVAPGEDPANSLKKALYQQLGHEVQAAQLIDTVSTSTATEQVIALLYLVGIQGVNEKFVLSGAHESYDWMKLSNIQPKDVTEMTKIALQLTSSHDPKEKARREPQKNDEVSTTNAREVIVYTDGGSRGNPGPSAAGFVVLNQNEEVLFEGGKYLGVTTNNQAEYQAVKLGLEKAHELGARVVKFRMDSLLIVNQMLGIYQIKNRDLWPIYASIKELVGKFDKVTFSHVRREFNQEADALVNKVLDERQ